MTDSDSISGDFQGGGSNSHGSEMSPREHKQSLDFGNNCNQNSSEMVDKSRTGKVMNHIPDDLAFCVLSKLPLKSLKRFGCVCQTWSLLFENSHFMSKFRTNFISHCHSDYIDTSLLLYQIIQSHDHTQYCSFYSLSGNRYENRVKLDFPNPFQVENPRFYFFYCDTITGTICLKFENTIVLWKPTTHEFKVIPPSPVQSGSPYRESQVFCHGFGYDPIRDDIKIITFTTFEKIDSRALQHLGVRREDVPWNELPFEPLWEIYSLRCNSWKKLDFDMPVCWFDNWSYERLYTEGVCHWWSNSVNRENVLVSFDLRTEMFFTTAIPLEIAPDTDPSHNFLFVERRLAMLNGSIASILWYTTTFHISILGELGVKKSWTKLFVVGPLSNIERVVGTGKNGDIFFKTKDGKLVLLDLSTGIIEDMSFKGGHGYDVAIFKENHILMDGINF
ncbi:unnamed protein product [Trifolium pratense]|uniref:Uncharacterized protein n=1 Tax=Trifolium pratense TaxID=57577 RepID=A0ACB0KG20_TRIPR|nr:unnamed protein product [Trifolium pratense]